MSATSRTCTTLLALSALTLAACSTRLRRKPGPPAATCACPSRARWWSSRCPTRHVAWRRTRSWGGSASLHPSTSYSTVALERGVTLGAAARTRAEGRLRRAPGRLAQRNDAVRTTPISAGEDGYPRLHANRPALRREPDGPRRGPRDLEGHRHAPGLLPDREPHVPETMTASRTACGRTASRTEGQPTSGSIDPIRPAWKSSNASAISAFVFMTNGP